MAKTTPVTFTVTITERDLPGFLDMLRYEQDTVASWERQPESEASRSFGERFKVTLRNENSFRFVPDRWASFGVYAREIES